jgi:hypothetical protein
MHQANRRRLDAQVGVDPGRSSESTADNISLQIFHRDCSHILLEHIRVCEIYGSGPEKRGLGL